MNLEDQVDSVDGEHLELIMMLTVISVAWLFLKMEPEEGYWRVLDYWRVLVREHRIQHQSKKEVVEFEIKTCIFRK